jgi:hypothetical protein
MVVRQKIDIVLLSVCVFPLTFCEEVYEITLLSVFVCVPSLGFGVSRLSVYCDVLGW